MDIVVRSLIIFAFIWVLMRLSGKRELAQLNAFDVVLLIVFGDLVSQSILHEDYSLTGAVIAVVTFTVVSMLIQRIAYSFPKTQPLLVGKPRVVVRRGRIDDAAMRAEQLTRAELNESARQQGIRDIREVDLCIMEVDGNFSFFTSHTKHVDD